MGFEGRENDEAKEQRSQSNEFNGFLSLSNEEYQAAKATKPNILPYAWEFLEYGESREGYWTRELR